MIRPATPQDAPYVAELMFQAMEKLTYFLINEENKEKAISLLVELFSLKNNQYSYENALVYEENNQILGSLVYYNGADFDKLSTAVTEYIQQKYGRAISLGKETEAGEYYIDTLSVTPEAQGKGIGSALLRYLKKSLKNEKLGLLVDVENPNAEKLYTRVGFSFVDSKILGGGIYKHLVW
ncbi:MAG: N-acetyltransferase [Capnocytophaga sp.]|nr:N-acetyltransferase [Capnocytophaga sp.]